jgi:hemoglobin
MQLADPVAEVYSKIGSDEPYYRLVEAFYSGVENDPELRPIYPPDLAPGKKHLSLFLIQRTGGPQTYSEERGHPRMRARHLPFKIGIKERDAWIRHMTQALDTVPEFTPHKSVLMEFFENFATFIINQPPSQ